MPTTTNYALRYPVLTDTANVPRDIGYLAADVDTAIRNQRTVGGTATVTTGADGRFSIAHGLGVTPQTYGAELGTGTATALVGITKIIRDGADATNIKFRIWRTDESVYYYNGQSLSVVWTATR